jgi:WD40-like Beta Propeller Repeat
VFRSGLSAICIVLFVGMDEPLLAAPSVAADLAARGFGLSTLTGGFTRRDLYFDSTWRDVHLALVPWGGIEIEADRTLIGGDRDRFIILDPNGKLLDSFPQPPFAYVVTWNRKSNLVAAITRGQGSDQSVLEYWTMGSQQFTIGERLPDSTHTSSIGWSPDGSAITFSKGNQVLVYNLAKRESVVIADGTNPAWSPDGNWIAYRDNDGHASLIHPQGGLPRVLTPAIRILQGVRWSPDSDFLLVTLPRRFPRFDQATELLIYRLADGATMHTDPQVGSSAEDRVFWIAKQK